MAKRGHKKRASRAPTHGRVNRREAAQILGVSPSTVRHYEERGILRSMRDGPFIWFNRVDVERVRDSPPVWTRRGRDGRTHVYAQKMRASAPIVNRRPEQPETEFDRVLQQGWPGKASSAEQEMLAMIRRMANGKGI